MQCHSHPYDPIEHDEFYQFAALFNNTLDCDQDDDFPRMKVAEDPAKTEEVSKLETGIRELRDELNADGRALAASAGDWKPFAPDAFAPSHGELAMRPGRHGPQRGHAARRVHPCLSGPAAPFTALRLEILPDSDDPKKWPERGSFVSKFEVRLIDLRRSVVTPVAMKEVFADHLDGPFESNRAEMSAVSRNSRGRAGLCSCPLRRSFAGEGMRLEVSMKQNAQTTGEPGHSG